MLVTNRKLRKLGTVIKEERGLVDYPVLGHYQITLTDLLEAREMRTGWFNPWGAKTGRVKVTAQWQPVTIKSAAGTGGYFTPIGVMHLHFRSAKQLRNMEALG